MGEEAKRYTASLGHEDEPGGDRFEYRRDLASALEDCFPQYYRASSLLVFWGIFEENLHQLCYSLAKKFQITEPFKDGKGSGMDKSKDFLTKKMGWIIPNCDWERLKRILKIRNIMAHRTGYLIEPEEAQSLMLAPALVTVSGGARHKIELKADYLSEFLDVTERFWKFLEGACLAAKPMHSSTLSEPG